MEILSLGDENGEQDETGCIQFEEGPNDVMPLRTLPLLLTYCTLRRQHY